MKLTNGKTVILNIMMMMTKIRGIYRYTEFLSLGKSSVGILGVCQYQHHRHHQHHHCDCQSDHLDQGYAREAGQASRCKRISRRCRSTDFACLRKPVIFLIDECDVKKCLIKKGNFLISRCPCRSTSCPWCR